MWGKIAIGMRIYGDPKADFFSCFIRLMQEGLRPGDRVLAPALRGLITDSLTKVCKTFLASDCDSILLLEDDIIFQPDDLEKLRKTGADYGIFGALFCSRRFPFNPQVFRSVYRSKNNIENLNGVIEVEAMPLGFCLVRREVIEAIEKRNKGRIARLGASDDCMSFCEDTRILGFKIGLNTDVSIGHLMPGVAVYWDRRTGKPHYDLDNYNK